MKKRERGASEDGLKVIQEQDWVTATGEMSKMNSVSLSLLLVHSLKIIDSNNLESNNQTVLIKLTVIFLTSSSCGDSNSSWK